MHSNSESSRPTGTARPGATTAVGHHPDACVHTLFEEYARLRTGSLAVVSEEETIGRGGISSTESSPKRWATARRGSFCRRESFRPSPRRSRQVRHERKAFTFGSHGGLVGVVCEPDAGPRPDVPAVLLFNVGLNHRVGPGRLNVDLARRLAHSGYATLRFDLSGLGDSEPRDDPRSEGDRAVVDLPLFGRRVVLQSSRAVRPHGGLARPPGRRRGGLLGRRGPCLQDADAALQARAEADGVDGGALPRDRCRAGPSGNWVTAIVWS